MASHLAIAATSKAVLGVLQRAAATDALAREAAFSLQTSADLQVSSAEQRALSLYLYHVNVNGDRRGAASFGVEQVRSRLPKLRLDLHYLLIAWARTAEVQQSLLGWATRTLQDTPVLGAAVLNAALEGPVFAEDETVELVWENLGQQELFDIWEVARSRQQPSATYLARVVEIDSRVRPEEHAAVRIRDLRWGPVTR